MELHPILEKGECPAKPKIWYVISAGGITPPSMRVGHSATALQSSQTKVLLLGGGNPNGVFPENHLLNLDSYEWEEAKWSGLKGRYEHTAFIASSCSGKVFVFGGANQAGNMNDMQVLELGAGQWTNITASGEAPTARTCRGSAVLGDQLYIFCGGEQGADPVSDCKLHVFDATTSAWTQPSVNGKVPKARHGHILVAVGSKLYLHGGMARESIYDDLFEYDIETSTWKQIRCTGDIPPGTAAHGAVAHNQDIVIFGGMTKNGASDSTYILNTETFQWKKIELSGPPPASRLDHAMCVVKMNFQRAPSPMEPSVEVSKDVPAGIVDITDNAMFVVDGVQQDLPAQGAGDSTPRAQAESSEERLSNQEENDISAPEVKRDAEERVTRGVTPGTTGDSSDSITCVLVHGGMDTGGQIFDDCLVMRLDDL